MISNRNHMLATGSKYVVIRKLDSFKKSGKRKQNMQMEKFKELSQEELQNIEGGIFPIIVALGAAIYAGYEYYKSIEPDPKPAPKTCEGCVLV